MIIYCATNKTNGMRYVGKTACGLQKRKRNHESDARKDSRLYFHRAIKKYGADGFTWDVIYRSDNETELNRMEKNFIRMFKSTERDKGYNLTHGGEGCIPNEETRAKLRGKHTEEHKKRISGGKKGKKFTEQHKKNLREAHKGVQAGEKHPMFGKTGEKSPMFGKKHSGEARAKMGEVNKDKTIYTFQHDVYGIIASTKYDLRIKYGLYSGNLSKLISGKQKSHKGWRMAGGCE